MIRRVLVVCLVAVSLIGCSDEGATPTLSFDGEAATYSGPETFSEMPVTFVLENPTTKMVGFGWSLVNDDSVTLDDAVAWVESHAADDVPAWVADYGRVLELNFMNDTREESTTLPEGKVLLWVWSQSDKARYMAAEVTVDTG